MISLKVGREIREQLDLAIVIAERGIMPGPKLIDEWKSLLKRTAPLFDRKPKIKVRD